MKITKGLRRYTAPDRGSITRKIYNKRTTVERVNSYLKSSFNTTTFGINPENELKFIAI